MRPDLDAIEALSTEREALWTRLDKATFLTTNEKRAAIGYGPIDQVDSSASQKYRPDQPRVPAGQPGGGQWTDGGGGATPGGDKPPQPRVGKPIRLAQVGGASTMVDTLSDRSPSILGAYLQAPVGRTISTFTVSPLTNNIYPSPSGSLNVTGWTAYYGPPGTRLLDERTDEERQSYGGGALMFVNPSETRTHTVPVEPGI